MRPGDIARPGVYAITVTPFLPDESVDEDGMAEMARWYAGLGVTGLTVLGVAGEANKLTQREAETVVTAALSGFAGSGPVIVGVSGPNLRATVELARFSAAAGAAGIMVMPMGGLRTDAQVIEYFRRLIEAVGDLPICLQDYPQVSSVPLPVPLLLDLLERFPSIVTMKHEDVPGLAKLTRLVAALAQRERPLNIVVGNNGIHYPEEHRRGAAGAMTGFAYLDMLIAYREHAAAGDLDSADRLFEIFLPLLRHELQPGFGLALRKEILRRRGAIGHATLRYPGAVLDDTDRSELTRMLDRIAARLQREALSLPHFG